MATKLGLYNEGLRLIGERKLASISESREPRRVLDDVWDAGLVRYVLERGLWKFAMRSITIDYSPSIDPDFGYQHGFEKPDDWVRTAEVASDGHFSSPLLAHHDEAAHWWSDLETIYVRFISDDAEYGGNLLGWPETFTRYVGAYLAAEICERLTQSRTKAETLEKKAKRRLDEARSSDAMNDPTKFMPIGSWASARGGGGGRSRGNRGQLIG